MNLIEAIKSGKPFRRKIRTVGWICPDEARRVGLRTTYDDIVADDWEIKEPTVTITATQFWSDVELVFGIKVDHTECGSRITYSREYDQALTIKLMQLSRKLGLED